MKKKTSGIKGILLCIFVAFIWGVAFSAQEISGKYMGPFTFTSIRYFFAAITTLAALLIFERKADDKARVVSSIFSGGLCGVVMFFAVSLQQSAIKISSESGKIGFITALYILVVPLFGLFSRRFPKANVWMAVFLGLSGMFLLTMKDTGSADAFLSPGEILAILSVILWALHIVLIGKLANHVYPVRFSMVQFLTCSAMGAWAVALGADGLEIFGAHTPSITAVFGSVPPILCLIYTGFISVGLGYTLQTIAQKNTDPTSASLALSLESVFAVISEAVILRQPLNSRGYFGCIIIFTGIVLSQLPGEWFTIKRLKRKRLK